MSTWSSWLFSGEKKEEKDPPEDGSTQQEDDLNKDSTWTKGLEIAGGWVNNVTSYASVLTDNVKKQVNETTTTGLLGDFQKEQEKFERKKRQVKDASVPPWYGYNEEEQIKTQVLELSADSRNFLREPPHGLDFPFDYDKVSPVAMVMLKEDPRLQKIRFELVPKKVSEKSFWRNYFYRISLIKQSVQLSTLSAAESPKPVSTSSDEPREQPDSNVGNPHSSSEKNEGDKEPDLVQPSGEDESVEEFASDQLYNSSTVSKDTVKSELNQLGVTKEDTNASSPLDCNTTDIDDNWDELKAELEELDLEETVGDGDIPPDWEEEIQSMLSEDHFNTSNDN